MLKYLENLTESQKIYYENICKYLKNGEYEAAKVCIDSISEPLEKFKYITLLKDFIDYNDIIETYLNEKYVDKESYEIIKEETIILIEKEKKLNAKIDQHIENMYENNILQEELTLPSVKTLVYFMLDNLNEYT